MRSHVVINIYQVLRIYHHFIIGFSKKMQKFRQMLYNLHNVRYNPSAQATSRRGRSDAYRSRPVVGPISYTVWDISWPYFTQADQGSSLNPEHLQITLLWVLQQFEYFQDYGLKDHRHGFLCDLFIVNFERECKIILRKK